MELDIINKNDQLNQNYYQLEFDGQNVEKSPSFKKWYENSLNKINNKNKDDPESKILCIFYCRNCKSYTICSCTHYFSCVKCNKCERLFCPGCDYIKSEENKFDDESACLKGYWILWKLRVKNCRSSLPKSFLSDYILHIILCIFFTPLYLGLISFLIGLFSHSKIDNEEKTRYKEIFLIYSILFGLLMFPYIIALMPIMILILIPGIFNHNYYKYVFNAYVTAALPGSRLVNTDIDKFIF